MDAALKHRESHLSYVPLWKFYNFHCVSVSVSSLKRLIRLWTERYPDAKVDPVNVWDDIVTSR